MANIAIFKPGKQAEYLQSVNTGDFVVDPNSLKSQVVPKDASILINPDTSVVKDVPVKYWKRVGDGIVEASTAEKQAIENERKTKQLTEIDDYTYFDGSIRNIVKALVDKGLVTKQQIIDTIKETEGLL